MKKFIASLIIFCLTVTISFAADFVINISGFSYSPASISVNVGDNVTIQASNMHPFVQVSQANWNANNPEQLAGGLPRNTSTFTFTVTADMVGTIYFGCENHMASSSMKGSISVSGALPLKLISFSAKKSQSSVELLWKTASEINISRFEIEKSLDGISFNSVGTVNAHNDQNTVDYRFNENIILYATVFYRLKLVELSGEISYSNVIRISNKADKQTIVISPNPAKKLLMIYSDNNTKTNVDIYNSIGKLILRKTFNNSTEIDVSLWESGIYYAKTKIDSKIVSKSFIVNHQ